MNTQDTLELAKQGDTQAISILMNQALQPKGITGQVSITGKSMTVVLESQTPPDEKLFSEYVRKAIEKLQLPNVKRLYIRGQLVGNKNPVWRQTINLEDNQISTPITTATNSKTVSNRFHVFNKLIQYGGIINTIFLGGILAILLFNLWWEKQPRNIEWEYTIESFEDICFDTGMQRMGNEGWELVFARRALSGEDDSRRGVYECIFKRPKRAGSENKL